MTFVLKICPIIQVNQYLSMELREINFRNFPHLKIYNCYNNNLFLDASISHREIAYVSTFVYFCQPDQQSLL